MPLIIKLLNFKSMKNNFKKLLGSVLGIITLSISISFFNASDVNAQEAVISRGDQYNTSLCYNQFTKLYGVRCNVPENLGPCAQEVDCTYREYYL